MSFVRPSLSDLSTRIQNDVTSRLGLAGTALRRSFVAVLARVLAGAAHLMHGHLDFLSRQLFPDQSEAEFLVRQAACFGVTRTAPTFTTAMATFTGDASADINGGEIVTSAAGFEYRVDSGGTFTDPPVPMPCPLVAVLPGSAPVLEVGAVLTFSTPLAGVNATCTVTSTLDGTDEEPIDALRVRLLERLANPAHGGSVADYVAWSKEVAGVTRVWVTPLELGPGTVVVRFARDNDASPIPDSGEVTAVQTHINAMKPAHATVTVAAPTDAATAMTIHIVPDNTTTRAAVTAQLRALFMGLEPGATTLISAVRTAIGTAPGVTDYTLTTPTANATHTASQLPSLGTITWS